MDASGKAAAAANGEFLQTVSSCYSKMTREKRLAPALFEIRAQLAKGLGLPMAQ